MTPSRGGAQRVASLLASVLLALASPLSSHAASPSGSGAGAAAPMPRPARAALERDWCTGAGPVSWGFTVTPSEACRGIHLRSRSLAVKVTSVSAGPGMPIGWTAAVTGERELQATGPSEIPAGGTLPTCLVVETNRSTSELGASGAKPVEWEVWFTDASGAPTQTGRMNASFPAVLDLSDAAARGTILVTCEALGPWGPVEITVDNPTISPAWIDVPPGSVLSAGGAKWMVGLTTPFRMMRRQKTGMTVSAFPLAPPGGGAAPKRLSLGTRVDAQTKAVQELALAARRLSQGARNGLRTAGPFESAEPYDFWPMALEWAWWQAGAPPPERGLLINSVARLLADKASAGDTLAARLDRDAAVAELESAIAELKAQLVAVKGEALPIEHLCAKERFR